MHPIGLLACALACAAPNTAVPPTIDGFLDDPFWANNARVWSTYRPGLPDHSARFQIGFDADAVYFSADVTDADLTGDADERFEDVSRDDAVQLFLDTSDGDQDNGPPDVHQFAFSVAGGAEWHHVADPATQPALSRPAESESALRWVAALKPDSTLNNSSDRDNGYIIEAAIPWAELGVRQPPAPGRTIGICFINSFKAGGPTDGAGVPSTAPADSDAGRVLPSLWQRIHIAPPDALPLRGLTESLPLWLGTSMYANQWRRFAAAQVAPNGPWLDRPAWQAKFERMASMGYNALLLLHPHPYCGLLTLEQFPGACYFTPDALPRHMEQFRWLLAEAKSKNVRVYLLTWNICLPPKWAEANGLAEFGSDTPLARAYTRQAVKDLFSTYPDLAGLATMAAESPPGCIDFVVDAIAGGMNETRAALSSQPADGRPLPELIFWSWCSYPEDTRRVLAVCPETRLMQYVQYEQWFKPMVDPRVARFVTWATAAPLRPASPAVSTITLGGPKSSLGYLFWGDADWLRRVAIDLRRQGADGIFFEPYCAENWLAQEAMAYYAVNPEERFDLDRWTSRLDEIYGTGQSSLQLLEAMQHASAIVPRFLTLVHSQSDHYMPQFGLPLSHYIEMPTLSSYVYENTQITNEQGYLTPRLGLTWPNPDWGERVAGIREEARKIAPPGATLPSEIAREIGLHASACRSRLATVKQVQPQSEEQARRLSTLITRLELNASLGEHFSQKILAALAWERLKAGEGQADNCLDPLDKSVQAWEAVSEIADRLYPRPVRHWQSQIVSPPPWTQNDLWNSYRLVEGHWRDQLPRLRRESSLIRQALSIMGREASLPMWDHLDATPDDNLVSLYRITFRNGAGKNPQFRLGPGTSLTTDPSLAHTGGTALLADTRSLGDGVHGVLTTDPQAAKLIPGMPCQITLVYRVVDRGGVVAIPFEIGVCSADGAPPLGDHRFWTAPEGHTGMRVLKTPAITAPDAVFYLNLHGRAAILIDQINIQTLKTP